MLLEAYTTVELFLGFVQLILPFVRDDRSAFGHSLDITLSPLKQAINVKFLIPGFKSPLNTLSTLEFFNNRLYQNLNIS